MDTPKTEIIERFGLFFEEDGMPRIAGRVFGLMLLSEESLTLDEIAEDLHVSKGSVSTNTRLLHHFGILERVTKPGDRRTYYQLTSDALSSGFDRVRERTEAVEEFLSNVELRIPPDCEVARRRISRMARWYRFVLCELDSVWQRWHETEDKTSK